MSIIVDVNPTSVSENIRLVGKATFSAASVAVSLPVGFDLEAATRKFVGVSTHLAGKITFVVDSGSAVQSGELIARVGRGKNADILATAAGNVTFVVESGATVAKEEAIASIKTIAAAIPANTVDSWKVWLEYWSTREESDIMPARELAASRINALFALNAPTSAVWQSLCRRPALILTNQDRWDNALKAIESRSIATKQAAEILSGKTVIAPVVETPAETPADSTPAETPADSTPAETPADSTPAETPADSTPAKSESDIRVENARNRAQQVRNAANMAADICTEIARMVQTVETPADELSVVSELGDILVTFDQGARLVLVKELLTSIALDA